MKRFQWEKREHCTKIGSRKFIYRIHVSSDMRIINTSRRAQKHIRLTKSALHSRLLSHPIVPLLPFLVLQTHGFTLVPHQLSFAIFPCSLPSAAASIPACLPHQADERLVFRPLLLFRDARKVGCAVAAGVQCERDADAMGADSPVIGIAGRRGEVREQRHVY
jgi:hypothetical protein